MNEHLQFDEDLELYALGVLDADERDAFETHLATCSICKERLAQAQQRVGFWGTNVEQMQPSAHVKQSLMERVRLESSHRVVSQHSSERRSFWSFFSQPMLAWGCAAVVAVVAVILASQTQTLKNRLNSLQAEMQTQEDAAAKDRRVAELLTSPQTQRVALKQPTDAARPEAECITSRSRACCSTQPIYLQRQLTTCTSCGLSPRKAHPSLLASFRQMKKEKHPCFYPHFPQVLWQRRSL